MWITGIHKQSQTHCHGPDGVRTNGLSQGLQHWGDPTQEQDEEHCRIHIVGQEI